MPLNTEAPGNKARSLLSKIRQDEEQAKTSALTIDEILWNVKNHRNLNTPLTPQTLFLTSHI
jgi:hypothetical protein